MKLVDDHVNSPSSTTARESADPPEALYIRDDIILHNAGPAAVDLNHLRLYYGGTLTVHGADAFVNGQPIPLIQTEYGDFNGDCIIDAADETIFLSMPGGGESVHAAIPILDYDGDCDVDDVERDLFHQRLQRDTSQTASPGVRPPTH
jgi:hypothetical protein